MGKLRGSMVALVTPCKNVSVDEEALRALARWQIEKGTDALVPCGTTGEGATLTSDERFKVVRACAEESRAPAPGGARGRRGAGRGGRGPQRTPPHRRERTARKGGRRRLRAGGDALLQQAHAR